ncbi:MAG: hypothetical protein ACKVQC_04025 [Elusimicrobiota bacterium]
MNTEIKSRTPHRSSIPLGVFIGGGLFCILVALTVLGFSLWESFGGSDKMRLLNLPGFYELDLKRPGLYAGVYQHKGSEPLPINELTKMSVRLMSKDTYEEVSVVMNSAGQAFNRLGFQGLPLFNFVIPEAGVYNLSSIYTGGMEGKTHSILLISAEAANIKQTLIVGFLFFAFFLTLGILILIKASKLEKPKPITPQP